MKTNPTTNQNSLGIDLDEWRAELMEFSSDAAPPRGALTLRELSAVLGYSNPSGASRERVRSAIAAGRIAVERVKVRGHLTNYYTLVKGKGAK
jgi:hypothetical protein